MKKLIIFSCCLSLLITGFAQPQTVRIDFNNPASLNISDSMKLDQKIKIEIVDCQKLFTDSVQVSLVYSINGTRITSHFESAVHCPGFEIDLPAI